MIRMAALAYAAAAMLYAGSSIASAQESDNLRLRPLKEPNTGCAQTTGNCSSVPAPRIDRRRSTIPGIQHRDRGQPPVQVMRPPSPPTTSGGSLGGNPGISGN
jgi:hypothetical protein